MPFLFFFAMRSIKVGYTDELRPATLGYAVFLFLPFVGYSPKVMMSSPGSVDLHTQINA